MTLFQIPAAIRTHSIRTPGVSIDYPSVIGLPDRNVEEHLNRTIYALMLNLQKEQKNVQTGTQTEMIGHYEIKTNERGILSLILSNYAYSRPMAHGYTIAKSLTFNLNTGKVYSLRELFKPGSDYVKALSLIVDLQIKQRRLPTLNGFKSIQPDQDYYLADKTLVLYFQLYEITPYYVGLPMFPISIYSIQSITDEASPLAALSADLA